MIIKNKLSTILLVATSFVFGQEATIPQDSIVKKETKISYLDSIKATFVNDDMATCIDSLWMKELTSLDIYSTLLEDIKKIDIDKTVDYELPTDLLKERLKKLDEKSPFNIEYNIGLENVIKSFLKNRKKGFERLMGISQFYFPIFEEALAVQNIPLEIKYLAVVESALNPRAVSRVGATGLWQFMYQTGKQYGLNITTYVDERSDPLRASQAATQYMTNMYKIFGDWDLVLASYNSGPGNVAKAIRRSGGQQNYWNIRKNLPKETQGYLPAFLATMYIFEYHKEHGIVPNKAVANHFATDTIQIKNHITFKQISDLLDIPVAEIQFFNPSFKRNEIPAISGEKHFLRLPKDKISIFTSNEDKVYAYVKYEADKRERPYERLASVKQNDSTNIAYSDREFVNRTKYHKVRKGDNLSEIADKHLVSISDIKKWNRLKSDNAPIGRNLKIIVSERIAYKDKKDSKADSTAVKNTNLVASETNAVAVNEAKTEKVFKTEKVVVFKDVTKYHKVKKGDVLGEIADKYEVSVADIKKWNKIKGSNIGLGDNLKIIKNEKVVTTVKKEVKQPFTSKKEVIAAVEPKVSKAKKEEKVDSSSKSENYYVVAKGDNLSAIARKNNVSVQNIKEWNNLIDTNVKVGTQLIISGESLTEAKEETVSKADLKNIEHVVGKGEYLGTIARKYNVTVNDLLELNSLSDTNIKEGDKLIVGKEQPVAIVDKKAKKDDYAANQKKAREKMYQVRKGDSLFSISQKFPGVTISDIKKWNNIKGESIQPGMKLKING
ncbi:LysM peptidoglycan-binding domain-containing protein [Flavobacterium sp.]|uniref:LysM peptidoglycan-binding domain-containing protein n=1 Tax=Flavobacterium sp. TaxID=239 RepID=UPI0026337F8E|nr:LysM peptidoglycan-binding domain-containing protein [Flavobacterium sp.]